MADPITQNALQLRHLAEHASSLRGVHLNVFGAEADGKPLLSFEPLAISDPFVAPMMELDTRFQQPWRAVPEVTITMEGRPMSLASYDAVFWSEAAVEKFVLPYYASKSLWLAAYVLSALSRHWYGFLPGVDPAPDPAGPLPAGENLIPFALAHLPTSDYIMLDEPGADLHLLYRQPDGSVLPRSLAELLREEREAGGQNG
jgi:hypothetical protein